MNALDWAAKNRRAMYKMLPKVENWVAAYKLSQEEARDIAVSYVLNNLLALEKPVAFAKDGAPTCPKVGERVRLKLDNIGGVALVPDSKAASAWTMTGPMNCARRRLRPECAARTNRQWVSLNFGFGRRADLHGDRQ